MSPSPLSPVADSRLTTLVQVLAGHPGPPLVAGLADLDTESPTLLEHRLGGDDPVVDLFGRTAPPAWDGVAFRAGARAHEGGRSLVVAVALTRDGSGAVATAEPPQPAVARPAPAHALEGHVVDACRRIIGLPNPPPNVSTTHLLALQWLDAVAARATDGAPLGWDHVVRLHPAVVAASTALETDRPGTGDLAVENLAVLGRLVAEVWPWSRIRGEVAAGTSTYLGLTPGVVEWMDDGMFSRWTVGQYPTRADIVDVLTATLPELTVRRIEGVLADWDNSVSGEAARGGPPPRPA